MEVSRVVVEAAVVGAVGRVVFMFIVRWPSPFNFEMLRLNISPGHILFLPAFHPARSR